MRFRLLALVAALLVTQGPPARAEEPIRLTAILSLTGSAAFIGTTEIEAMRLAIASVNAHGGVRGRPIALSVVDDQSNPQVAVQLANQLIGRDQIFLGPPLTGPCVAVAPLLKNGPVAYCLTPGVNPPENAYYFSAGNSTDDDMIVLIRYFRLRGWKRIALVTTTDASGQAIDRGTDIAMNLPENRDVQLVAHEHFALTDVSVSAQMTRVKAAAPQALIAWATGTPFGTLLHGIQDAGIELPTGAGSGNMVYAQLHGYGALMPRETYFPGAAAMSPEAVRPGPIRTALQTMIDAYRTTGKRYEFLSTLAWDPTMIVVDTLRTLGPNATAAQIREHIATLHGWVGVNGVYDFRDGKQRGIGQNTCVIDRWDAANERYVAVSRPGGYLR